MKSLLSPKIPTANPVETDLAGDFYMGKNGWSYEWFVCGKGLRRYFDVPQSATAIQLECKRRRVKDSLEVSDVDRVFGTAVVDSGDRIKLGEELRRSGEKFLRSNEGKPFYVKCYYWE